ncbi:hypothetical protein ACFQ1I_44945 [Kitasatospora arboriphila]
MPTPARRAMSSREASAPCSAKASRAATSSASKFRAASARRGRWAARNSLTTIWSGTVTSFRRPD